MGQMNGSPIGSPGERVVQERENNMRVPRYSNLPSEIGEKLISHFNAARQLGATDPKHATAIAAHEVLCPDLKKWNAKQGSEAYSVALTWLVHHGHIKVSFWNEEGN